MDYGKISMFVLISLLSLIDQVQAAYRSYRYYSSYRYYYSSYRYTYYTYYYSTGSWVIPVAVCCSLAGVGIIVGIIICIKCCVVKKNKPGVVVTPSVTVSTVNGGVQPPANQSAVPMYTYNQPPPPPSYVPQNGGMYPPPPGPAYAAPTDPAYPPPTKQ